MRRFTNKQAYYRAIKNRQAVGEKVRDEFNASIKEMVGRAQSSSCILAGGVLFNSYYKRGKDFVWSRQPNTNFQDVEAYVVDASEMDKVAELKCCGGCYVPDLKTILIKNGKINIKPKTKLDKCLFKYQLTSSLEDVFVHELFHAASHADNRKTRTLTHLEEEFVYKSTVEWFKKNGLTDDQIIDTNFLPFALQDILMQQKNDIIYTVCGFRIDWGSKDGEKILQDNAEKFVEEAVSRARNLARRMLDIPLETTAREEDARFSFLDLD